MLRIIGGIFKGKTLKTPKTQNTRPTQSQLREAVFNICQNYIESATFLDLFAGSGAMGFEALSRGASFVSFVEQNKLAYATILENASILDVKDQVFICKLDAETAIDKLKGPFDIIYIDPPYDLSIKTIFTKLLQSTLIKPGSIIFLEQRFEPKKESKPFEDPKILLKSSRKFATTILFQYLVLD